MMIRIGSLTAKNAKIRNDSEGLGPSGSLPLRLAIFPANSNYQV